MPLDAFHRNSCELSRYQRRGVGGRDWKLSRRAFPKVGAMWGNLFRASVCCPERWGLPRTSVINGPERVAPTLGNVTDWFSYMFLLFRTQSKFRLADYRKKSLSVLCYPVSGCCKVSATAAGTSRCWGTWSTAGNFVVSAACWKHSALQPSRWALRACSLAKERGEKVWLPICIIDWMTELFVSQCPPSLCEAEILGAPFPQEMPSTRYLPLARYRQL